MYESLACISRIKSFFFRKFVELLW